MIGHHPLAGSGGLSMPIRLIATDLDDTLLDSSGRIPRGALDALAAARARGIRVTLSTGRMLASALPLARSMGANAPFVCYNGAMIASPADGSVLFHQPIETGLAREVLSLYRIMGWYIQSYLEDRLLVESLEDPRARSYSEITGVPATAVGGSLFLPDAPPTKLLAIAGPDDDIEDMTRCTRACFGERLYIARSKARYLDMAHPDCNKGRALARVARDLGIPMEEVLAIGDSDNDAEMIAAAGVGVAMGNGSARARAVADAVAPSNDEGGVAWAVETYALA
jgi:Cof subfamily protein (haloacid dehalogenase superfamily)